MVRILFLGALTASIVFAGSSARADDAPPASAATAPSAAATPSAAAAPSAAATPSAAAAAPDDGATQRAPLRRLVVTGRVVEARSAILDRLVTDVSPAERAALIELLAIADTWAERGAPGRLHVPPQPPSSDDWNVLLDLARSDLVRGAYDASSRRLGALVTSAPDPTQASRAVELRSIARVALQFRPALAPTESPAETAKPSPPRKRWYGWQTLVADGIALTSLFVTAGLKVDGPALVTVPAAIYLTGGPVVHLMHDRFGAAAWSLAIRAGLPAAAGLLGALAESRDCSDGYCNHSAAIVLAGIAIPHAVVLDTAILAREPRPVAAPPSSTSASVRPSFGPRREGGFDVGLAGTW